MKIYSLITFLVFTAFAVIQFNDPDPLYWVSVYGILALEALLWFLKGRLRIVAIVTTVVLLIALALSIPGFIAWIRDGAELGIWGAMTDEKAYIEEVREFLGLLIALAFQVPFVIAAFKK